MRNDIIIFEGDCLEMVNAVSKHLMNNDSLSPILHDIYYTLESAPNWEVKYAPRLANRSAHALSKLACSFPHDVIWMEECPDRVLDVILEDKLRIDLFV